MSLISNWNVYILYSNEKMCIYCTKYTICLSVKVQENAWFEWFRINDELLVFSSLLIVLIRVFHVERMSLQKFFQFGKIYWLLILYLETHQMIYFIHKAARQRTGLRKKVPNCPVWQITCKYWADKTMVQKLANSISILSNYKCFTRITLTNKKN